MDDRTHMQRAVDLALQNATDGGEPFGAVMVQDGKVIAEAVNQAHIDHDPTAHAEIEALRAAGRATGRMAHPGSVVYASGKPCPMCMAAMMQAGVARVVYCADDDAGGPFGYSTEANYARMQRAFGDQGVQVDHLPLDGQTAPFERYAQTRNAPS